MKHIYLIKKNKLILLHIFMLLNLLNSNITYAQANLYKFNNITTKNGLPINDTQCVYKDSRGFMWFGTTNGLVRYDGFKMVVYQKNYNDNNSLCHNYINTIYEEPLLKDSNKKTENFLSRKLWILTINGVSIYDPLKDTFENLHYNANNSNSLNSEVALLLCFDTANIVWIVTNKGLNQYNTLTKQWRRYENKPNDIFIPCISSISSIFTDKFNNLWMSTWGGGISCFNTKKGTVTNYSHNDNDINSIPENTISNMAVDTEGLLWISTLNKGSGYFNSNTKIYTPILTYLKNNNLNNAKILINKNNIWFAGMRVITIYERNTKTYIELKNDPTNPFSLQESNYKYIYQDNNEAVWISGGNGIAVYSPNNERFAQFYKNIYNKNIDKSYVPVQDFLKCGIVDSSKNVWMGLYGDGLMKYNITNNSHKRIIIKQLEHINIIIPYKNGMLWIGTTDGLFLFNTLNPQ